MYTRSRDMFLMKWTQVLDQVSDINVLEIHRIQRFSLSSSCLCPPLTRWWDDKRANLVSAASTRQMDLNGPSGTQRRQLWPFEKMNPRLRLPLRGANHRPPPPQPPIRGWPPKSIARGCVEMIFGQTRLIKDRLKQMTICPRSRRRHRCRVV